MKKIIIPAVLICIMISCKGKEEKQHTHMDAKSSTETTATQKIESTEAKAKDLEQELDKATKELNELLKDL